ncbi:hypothetical protein D1818_16565 [Aquimarina sp. BL5]|uniref:hypothetical protein n=1 Tax=Aquimarina sp. BL5 TaxID=1714860 RepID=UPI000E4720AD|nr:hypothetical protein [Aquimarina sp. BL5]AXT52374.1 hypothetical protein D1818_16565 [Aquimarina sp. BL5]RKN10288.1 hypothetical protein D7036_02945 [Aquimarina sp. BL5]
MEKSAIIETIHHNSVIRNTNNSNAEVLKAEVSWLSLVLQTRLELHFQQETPYTSIEELVPPNIVDKEGSYARFIQQHKLNFAERLLLILALVPHIKPEVLDILLTKNKYYNRRYSEFGGLLLEGHLGLIPTFAIGKLTRRKLYNYSYKNHRKNECTSTAE